MNVQQARTFLLSLSRKWKGQALVFYILISAAFSVLCTALLYRFQGLSILYIAPIFFLAFGFCFVLFRFHRVADSDIAGYLNYRLPSLEDSSELLLRHKDELEGLALLQAARISERIDPALMPRPFRIRLLSACLLFLISSLAGLWLFSTNAHANLKQVSPQIKFMPGTEMGPTVTDIQILITPPAYTGHSPRTVSSMKLELEEGALVKWRISISSKVDSFRFIFNDSLRLNAMPENEDRTVWILSEKIKKSGYYQLQVGAERTQLYSIEIIRDQPPHIVMILPKEMSRTQKSGTPPLELKTAMSDDYGLDQAYIQATIASGSGEAIKFRELKIPFSQNVVAGSRSAVLSKSIDLAALDLQPGDDLYFYVLALDNQHQEARSGMYSVAIADSSQPITFDAALQVQLPIPEYFRSQRQIIIETEQLLQTKNVIDKKLFATKSNDLAIDQKILRLRYGKFLGEEGEETEGIKSQNNAATQDPADFGNLEKALDKFSDKHDNAQDADFFDPDTKKQLRNTLSEMWNAELKLRTVNPKEALAFEYKALRLLKDLQQKTRAYMAKTSIRNTNLSLTGRLSGDLSKITDPRIERKNGVDTADTYQLRIALSVLSQLKSREPVTVAFAILDAVIKRMGREAAADPKRFLDPFQAILRIRSALGAGGTASGQDIRTASLGIRKLIPLPEPSLTPGRQQKGSALSHYYFSILENSGTIP